VKSTRRAMLFMAVFAGLWAVIEAGAGGVLMAYSPYQVVYTRYVVHLAFMGLVWGIRDPRSLVRTRRPAFQMARSLLMLVMPASWVLSNQRGVDGRTLMSLFGLSPLLILAFSRLFLRERPSASAWVITVIAALGAHFLIGRGPLPSLPLLIFPAGMALSFSAYVVMTRSLRSETTKANLFYTAFGVVLALSTFVFPYWITPRAPDLAVMVAVGVVGFVGLFALDRATAAAPLSASAPLAYLQLPIFLGIQLFLSGARPSLHFLAGSSLIALGPAAMLLIGPV
jgi:drug/metabolite transporter (DMT)-like permease